MIRLNSVSIFFLLIFGYSHSYSVDSDDFFAIFGAYKQPYGKLFVFDDFGLARIKFNVKFDQLATPDLLNCEHYSSILGAGEPNQAEDVPKPAEAKAVKIEPRVKRDIDDTVTIRNANPEDPYSDKASNWTAGPGKDKLCAYKLDTKDTDLLIESENEEIEFQSLVRDQDLDRLICSNGWSENCLVRSLHSEKVSIWWYKVYDKRQRKFELRVKSEVFSPPRVGVPYMKEIMYRNRDLLRELTEDKTITANYKCLPSPYSGRKTLVPKDNELREVERTYTDRVVNGAFSKNYVSTLETRNIGSKR